MTISGLAGFTEDDTEIWLRLQSPDPWLLYPPVLEAATFGATRLSLSSQRALHTTFTLSHLEQPYLKPALCATHKPRTEISVSWEIFAVLEVQTHAEGLWGLWEA